jgi:hypothetical protein
MTVEALRKRLEWFGPEGVKQTAAVYGLDLGRDVKKAAKSKLKRPLRQNWTHKQEVEDSRERRLVGPAIARTQSPTGVWANHAQGESRPERIRHLSSRGSSLETRLRSPMGTTGLYLPVDDRTIPPSRTRPRSGGGNCAKRHKQLGE